MDTILSTVKWQNAFVYLDNGINLWRSVKKFWTTYGRYWYYCWQGSLSLNLKNRFFLENCKDYFGHETQTGRLSTSTKATKAILELLNPHNETESKDFLAPCTVFQKFAPSSIRKVAPLIGKLETDQPWLWTRGKFWTWRAGNPMV